MDQTENQTELEIPKYPDLQLRAACTHFLSGHVVKNQRSWLEAMAASPFADLPLDIYGEGAAVQQLEQEVAQLLGKEASIFIHKGIVAQQIALRVWADRTGVPKVALHPKSHLDVDERNAYERLHPLVGVRVGKDHRPFSLDELKALHEPVGVITVELPLRRAGYKLPTWEELTAISDWAQEQRIPLHFDGARLCESAPYYQRSLAEISALADSVYVSFYKGLGGLGGCILAGSQDFVDEVKVWKVRLGGNLFTAFPFIISALEGMRYHLPRMESYCARAREVAAALTEIPGVVITPNPPQTNAFQIYLPQDYVKLRRAARKLAETEKTWLFNFLDEIAVPGLTFSEITIEDAAEQWSTAEIVAAVRQLLALSRE